MMASLLSNAASARSTLATRDNAGGEAGELSTEALAAKDAAEALPEFDMVDSLIRSVAEHLGRSGPWHQRFLSLQEVFTATNLELQGIHNVRWLSRGDVVLRLVEVFPALIVMLYEWDTTYYDLATYYRLLVWLLLWHLCICVCS
ncbi:unnamed protein product [Closterium sp. NIES-53]